MAATTAGYQAGSAASTSLLRFQDRRAFNREFPYRHSPGPADFGRLGSPRLLMATANHSPGAWRDFKLQGLRRVAGARMLGRLRRNLEWADQANSVRQQ